MQRETVGIVGLGLLGAALAERLIQSGFEVSGFDTDPARMMAMEKLGMRRADDCGALAASADRLLLCLPTSQVVEEVLAAMMPSLRAGQVILDATTGDPAASAVVGQRLALEGIDYLDATVAGSSVLARLGRVLVMVGGRRGAFDECQRLLGSFASEVFYLGEWGMGSRMKLVVNLVLGLNRAALAEGLALAGCLGLDPAEALRVLSASVAYSRAMDSKGTKMIQRDFAPEARLSQHLKDVETILAAGRGAGAVLPLSALHRELLAKLAAAGLSDADNSAIIEAFRPGS